jgi:hypothetical protein
MDHGGWWKLLTECGHSGRGLCRLRRFLEKAWLMDSNKGPAGQAPAAFDVDDLAGAYLRSRQVHRRVLWACSLGLFTGISILAYLVLASVGDPAASLQLLG